METVLKVNRRFRKNALLMLQQSNTMLHAFIEYLPEFSSKFQELNVAFAAQWQADIDSADDAPDDEEVLDDQQMTTHTLRAGLRNARNGYTELMVYVKLAYPRNQAVPEHFGYSRYKMARTQPLEMKALMELAYERANSTEYKSALNAQGYSQVKIDELSALAQQLEKSDNLQKQAKTDRYMQTQNRNKLLNSAWEKMSMVNLASTVVFRNNYALLQLFKLYPERKYERRKRMNAKTE